MRRWKHLHKVGERESKILKTHVLLYGLQHARELNIECVCVSRLGGGCSLWRVSGRQ